MKTLTSEENKPIFVMSKVRSGDHDKIGEGRQSYDDSVRAVATYSRDRYNLHYVSSSVRESYTKEEIEEMHEEAMLEEIERTYQEELFKDMGEMEGVVRMFEDGIVAHFYGSDSDNGFLISIDDSINPKIRTLYEIAEEYE